MSAAVEKPKQIKVLTYKHLRHCRNSVCPKPHRFLHALVKSESFLILALFVSLIRGRRHHFRRLHASMRGAASNPASAAGLPGLTCGSKVP